MSTRCAAGLLNNLAGVYLENGRHAEALAALQQAGSLYHKINGANHPHLFYVLSGMAALQAGSGHYAEPVRSIESGIRVAEAGGLGNTILIRDALFAEVDWLHRLKREGEAKRVRAKAKLIARAAAGNSYPQFTFHVRQAAKECPARSAGPLRAIPAMERNQDCGDSRAVTRWLGSPLPVQ
jgi:hypothetical protein